MATNVALTGLARDMQARADSGRPIRIGLIGSGEMGYRHARCTYAGHRGWRYF